jgi:hypothetical protein
MTDATPQNTFRGLPLTAEQDAEIRHYIKQKKRHGAPWNTPELAAMIADTMPWTPSRRARNGRLPSKPKR